MTSPTEPAADSAGTTYPHPGLGDTLVLGPEIFAAGDCSVICWQGVNYVPAVELPEPPELPSAETLSVAAPMLDKARAQLGKRVTVHVIGGMQVTGKIDAIDEYDGVLSIDDGNSTAHVALHAIAVLVTR